MKSHSIVSGLIVSLAVSVTPSNQATIRAATQHIEGVVFTAASFWSPSFAEPRYHITAGDVDKDGLADLVRVGPQGGIDVVRTSRLGKPRELVRALLPPASGNKPHPLAVLCAPWQGRTGGAGVLRVSSDRTVRIASDFSDTPISTSRPSPAGKPRGRPKRRSQETPANSVTVFARDELVATLPASFPLIEPLQAVTGDFGR